MTRTPSQAQATPLRFRAPDTVSPEARRALAEIYEAARQAPTPAQPLSAADFADANQQMQALFWPSNAQLAQRLGAVINSQTIAGVPVVRITPPNGGTDKRLLVYVHGGAYVYFSAQTLVGLPSLIATATGAEVLSIDYTLAPQARWPAVTDQVLAVWSALIDEGFEPDALGLLGDSAGGGLAAGSVLKMRDQQLPLPGALWLLSPWSDISGAGDTYETLAAADPTLSPETLAWCAAAYAEPADQRRPYVSPVYGDYSKPFPPTLIQGGTREIFLSNFVRHYQAIRDGGHTALLDLYEGMPHVFQSTVPDTPEARTAIRRAAEFFHSHLRW